MIRTIYTHENMCAQDLLTYIVYKFCPLPWSFTWLVEYQYVIQSSISAKMKGSDNENHGTLHHQFLNVINDNHYIIHWQCANEL